MKNKKLITLMLSTAIMSSLAGCTTSAPATSTTTQPTEAAAETTASPNSGIVFKPGTYTGTAQGRNGELKVEVEVNASSISSVKVTDHTETPQIADPAIERIPQDIVKYQSLGVDAIAGCTITCDAIIEAVSVAVKDSGADVDALKAVEIVKEIGEAITKEADVVVIGAGGAGLAAAIEAKDQGAANVVLLEKMPSIGGTTFTSQGVIAGYETNVAKELDVHHTYDEMYENLMNNAQYRLDPELTKITVEKSGETIDWLEERIQIPFAKEIRVGYGPLQMMHVMDGAGPAMDKAFKSSLEQAGIDLMLETCATEILMNEDGSVAGVKAQKDGAEVLVHAKSVIIATGGYANNPELTALLDPEKEGTFGIGFVGSTGDGIIMANHVGAALTHTNHLMAVLKDYEIMAEHNGTSASASLNGFPSANNLILVGKDGKRFTDEKNGGYMSQDLNDPIFNQMHKDETEYVWAIAGKEAIDAIGAKRGVDLPYITADTPEDLAAKLEVDKDGLEETLKNYQSYVEKGFDSEFGRTVLEPLTAPFYAVPVVPCEIITYGGVARDAQAQVLRADQTVIPGLFVAGEAGANSAYMGFTLSNCFTWGRIAGANAAAYATK